jgi:hypothetical protein
MQPDGVAEGHGDMPESLDGSDLPMKGDMVTRRYGSIEEAVSSPS